LWASDVIDVIYARLSDGQKRFKASEVGTLLERATELRDQVTANREQIAECLDYEETLRGLVKERQDAITTVLLVLDNPSRNRETLSAIGALRKFVVLP